MLVMTVRNPLQFLTAANLPWRLPDPFTGLLLLQGLYYALTGLWPLISIESFQWVTGPKTDHLPTGSQADHWLVMTVGVLVSVVALTLLMAAWRGTRSLEIAVLAMGCAIGLAAIDVIYVARDVIRPIYLLDAAIEVPLAIAWAALLVRGRTGAGLRKPLHRPARSW